MPTEQDKPMRLPIKGETGDVLALVSIEGLQLWSRRARKWKTISIEELLKIHSEVAQLVVEEKERIV
jgi:hypothetical protein